VSCVKLVEELYLHCTVKSVHSIPQVIFTTHLKWERGLVLNRMLSKIKEILISILDLLKKVFAWSIIV
jgi:hypothetical protein